MGDRQICIGAATDKSTAMPDIAEKRFGGVVFHTHTLPPTLPPKVRRSARDRVDDAIKVVVSMWGRGVAKGMKA